MPTLKDYQSALAPDIAKCTQKETCFAPKTACKGVGDSRFSIVESRTQKPPKDFYCVDIDCLWPDPPEPKCDHVFIQLPLENPQRDVHFYFVELKKGNNFERGIKQIKSTIDEFKNLLKCCPQTPSLDKKQITGIVAGGASPRTNIDFQKAIDDFKKSHGKDLLNKSELRI